jgi:GTP-binding protein Era
MHGYKSGFVALIGRANVGKSTLMNYFVEEKISIVSPKPQTTRNKIRAILTGDDYQIVFIDTPGLHTPGSKLGEYMVKSAKTALDEADAVVYMVEPRDKIHDADKAIIAGFAGVKSPIFCAVNKADTVEKPKLLKIIEIYAAEHDFDCIVPLSALTGENTEGLLDAIKKVLPQGPQYYDADQLTDMPERAIAAEIIREKCLAYLQEEIPHGLAVEISEWKNTDILRIGATIFCEKDSHKGIVIGKRGEMLKKIGSAARHGIQRLTGEKIFLELWVKVKKNWRDNDFLLKNFGYNPKEI